jgi:hypothetical protein
MYKLSSDSIKVTMKDTHGNKHEFILADSGQCKTKHDVDLLISGATGILHGLQSPPVSVYCEQIERFSVISINEVYYLKNKEIIFSKQGEEQPYHGHREDNGDNL